MKFKKGIAILVLFSWGLLAFFLPALTVSSAEYLSFQTEDEANTIEIFKKASPSVVYVTNNAYRRASRFSLNIQEIPQGTGTGFVWNDEGLIVTNAHVISGADRVTITLQDQSTWEATVEGVAPDKDLALLRIDAPQELLQPLPLGDSSALEVGRKVLAIGNPFGLDTTLTVGVVSALGREIVSMTNRTIRDVIQTDAAINPGNSGGPLLNSLGQLIGVNSQTINPNTGSGIGFSIPVNTVKKIVPQLLEYGQEVRPMLGIRHLPENWTRQRGIDGLPVYQVLDGQPAAKAGLIGFRQNQRGDIFLGDIILEVDGEKVRTQDDLLNVLEQHQPGEKVKIITLRDQETLEFEVELAPPG